LTADNRLAGGLDRVLALLYAQHVNGPGLSHSQLRAALAGLAPSVTPAAELALKAGRPEDARRHAAALAGAALDERQRERLAAVQAGLE
jgi:hypothetical protein